MPGTSLILTSSCWLHSLTCPAGLPLIMVAAIMGLLCSSGLALWDAALVLPGTVPLSAPGSPPAVTGSYVAVSKSQWVALCEFRIYVLCGLV